MDRPISAISALISLSHQPAHTRSLIRAFAVRKQKQWILQNVWMESKSLDDTLRIHRMISICAFLGHFRRHFFAWLAHIPSIFWICKQKPCLNCVWISPFDHGFRQIYGYFCKNESYIMEFDLSLIISVSLWCFTWLENTSQLAFYINL